MTPTTYGRDFAYCLKSHGGVRGFNASLWRFLLRCTLFCHSVATFLTSVSSYEGGCGFEVIYNETHKKWIIAYFNADRYNITMRTAEDITGPWSEPYELANGREYAQLYGSYIHPLSVTGDNLYFTMSMWMPYNVFLMKAELADMGEF